MTQPAPTPTRDVTPDMQRRSNRTFLTVLLLFGMGISAMIAAFSWQGRVAREYGLDILRAVQASHPSEHVSYQQNCLDAQPKPLPRSVKDCLITVEMGQPSVTLRMENGQQYQVK